MDLGLSFTDFWEGHDPNNNILANMIKDVFDADIYIVPPEDADICFVTIYGQSFKDILTKYPYKSILWLGENTRPNTIHSGFSISFDFNSYNGKNLRLPLWMSEIDWYSTGLGVTTVSDAQQLLCESHKHRPHTIREKDCITIFNNPEGTRVEILHQLQSIMNVTGYGRPFNNWFPTYENYRDKLNKMGEFTFNLCQENSMYPGYYTEKCIHAKLSGCIPIYMADSNVKYDFRQAAFINIADFKNIEESVKYIQHIIESRETLENYMNEPLLRKMPSLDNAKAFISKAINVILAYNKY